MYERSTARKECVGKATISSSSFCFRSSHYMRTNAHGNLNSTNRRMLCFCSGFFMTAFLVVSAIPFSKDFVDASEVGPRENLVEETMDGEGSFAPYSREDAPDRSILQMNPADPLVLDDSRSTILDEQDLLPNANTNPHDGRVSKKPIVENGTRNRKRSGSIDPTRACPANLNPQKPIRVIRLNLQTEPFDDKNPCHSSILPQQLIHVSCGSHMVGTSRVYPKRVLNCVPGKLSFFTLLLHYIIDQG